MRPSSFAIERQFFGLVINESVLEHVKKPWIVVKELERVTKSSGYVYVKTAFMQPAHNCPAHYFNMTCMHSPKTDQKMRDVEIFENRVYGGESLLAKLLVRLYQNVSDLLKGMDRKIHSERAEKLGPGSSY